MMPNMQTTIHGFEQSFQFQIVTKTVSDHDVVETSKIKPILWFEGNLQPLNPRELLVKSEGERKFKWWTLITDLVLAVDSVVKDDRGLQFRVMASSDWDEGGYHQYQLIEGPGV